MEIENQRVLKLLFLLFITAGCVDLFFIQTRVIPMLFAEPPSAGVSSAALLLPDSRSPTAETPLVAHPESPARSGARATSPDESRLPDDTARQEGTQRDSETVVEGDTASVVAAEAVAETSETPRNRIDANELKRLPGIEPLRFGPNKTLLWKFEKKTLQEVAAIVGRYANLGVMLVGHADKAEKDPEALSADRAEKAKSFLVKHGVPAERIETDAMGSEKPAAKGTAEADRKKNRRVRVRFIIKEEI